MFLLKKSLQLIALAASAALLAACSSTGTGANANNAATTAANNGANSVQTAGLGSNNGLSNPNAMVPGANQRYFFDFNESNVHSSDLPSIKVQSQYLMAHPNAGVLLQGNTDIRGSREYNIALGQRRANAVKDVLKLDGVSAKQIRTISYGAEKPLALGNTETDYAMNRRVDLVYAGH